MCLDKALDFYDKSCRSHETTWSLFMHPVTKRTEVDDITFFAELLICVTTWELKDCTQISFQDTLQFENVSYELTEGLIKIV